MFSYIKKKEQREREIERTKERRAENDWDWESDRDWERDRDKGTGRDAITWASLDLSNYKFYIEMISWLLVTFCLLFMIFMLSLPVIHMFMTVPCCCCCHHHHHHHHRDTRLTLTPQLLFFHSQSIFGLIANRTSSRWQKHATHCLLRVCVPSISRHYLWLFLHF